MLLTLVERYIFRKSLLATLTAAGALIGVLWVVRAVQTVDVILSQGQGIVTYLKMTTLGVPTLAAAIAPLALLIGLIRTINAMNDDSELVVLHASGTSRLTLLKPFFVLCVLVMIVVYFLQLWAGPYSMRQLRHYVTSVRADLVSVVAKAGEFKKIGTGLTFHVGERAPGGVLKNLLILDGRSKGETFTYIAQQGTINKSEGSSFLILQNGQIHRAKNGSDNVSIVRFKSYAFNLSAISTGSGAAKRGQEEIPTYELFFPNKNESLYKIAPNRYFAELNLRLTSGLYPLMVGFLLLAYLGNPISHRQGQALVILAACGAILGLRGITLYAEGMMRNIPDMFYVVWVIPIFTIFIALFLLFTDRSAFSYRIYGWLERLGNRLSKNYNLVSNIFRSKSRLRKPVA